MKYVCINYKAKSHFNSDKYFCYKHCITIGRVYEINIKKIEIFISLYTLEFDDGEKRSITKLMVDQMFKPLSEVREEKINKILK